MANNNIEINSISDKVNISVINNGNREEINKFIVSNWYTTDMAIRGKLYDLSRMDGFAAYYEGKIVGLITYLMEDNNEYEIMSLDSLIERQGIGTALVNKVMEKAKKDKIKVIKLITTNDNINAIKFYQKNGFDFFALYRNAVDISRKLKPSIPEVGYYNIPIKDEIEF